MTTRLHRAPFRAMGTTCSVAVAADDADATPARRAIAAGRDEVAACERALSRFDAASDLSRLNASSGAWIEVDRRLAEALSLACRARIETRGRFDPTVLPALLAAGYDRSFELLDDRPARELDGWHPQASIQVDRRSGRARVERGAAVDLGGIGKGFAAARAVRVMRRVCPALSGGLVDLGGDIAVWGSPPEGGPWLVDVEDPRAPGTTAATLELVAGGVATSGPATRRFGPGDRFHHLIDPSTGRPAGSGPLAVTVVAPNAAEAEAFSTALAVTPVGDADDLLAARPELSALVVAGSGPPTRIGRLPVADPRPRARFLVTSQGGRFQCH